MFVVVNIPPSAITEIESSQKKRCAWPSFAAAPTQLEPTTNKICVSTRSRRASGFFRATLCCSTSFSARSSSLITRQIVGHADRLPTENWQTERLAYRDNSVVLLLRSDR